ncbi:MAG: Ig-like domain-containing protein [Candidatus Hydrogenedentes bacterium]|nr:Ig-like domain-containing protein [Candidatus Hydrogenedentota bacterium]
MMSLMEQLNSVAVPWAQWMTGMAWQLVVLLALVWLLAARGRWLSAGARHLLWLLVFVKLLLPPGLASPWAVGNIMAGYGVQVSRVDTSATPVTEGGAPDASGLATPSREAKTASFPGGFSLAAAAFAGWLAIAAGLLVLLLAQYHWHKRRVMTNISAPAEEAARVFREEKQRLGIRTPVSLFVSDNLASPAVFGVVYPMVLLPEAHILQGGDLRSVLAHELAHVKRRDVAAGWLASVLSCLYWFHPGVWLANLYLRREREMACDDMVLRNSTVDGADYASTILSVAQKCRYQAPVGAGLLGILEYSDNLMARVRSCADSARTRKMGKGAFALLIAVLLALPMGDWQSKAEAADTQPAAAAQPALPAQPAPAAPPAAAAQSSSVPEVVSTSPAVGATDVDPALTEIKVTFDQDMNMGGFSWTGGGEYFPETAGKPEWVDNRTCALHVKLQEAHFYRVGINSKSYNNFRGTNGMPARHTAIYFTTRGAKPEDVAALKPPKVVSLTPADRATDVKPGTVEAVVTFDQPMGGGMSFTTRGGKDKFPEMTGEPVWSADKKSLTRTLKLEPNKSYVIGLNSDSYINFSSDHGVPLEPVVWKFQTGN